ncbi:amine oxidase [Ectocarpus siliculosus]|uniref:Amine oxidase n=1 Tax=Ectocarpus siliculosus TaxID=2880 RepID=D8LSR2_ECTSI|nr:amine oxidase [Ectocarpus siliculosus]|eukprot:CBN75262.1 amine oxidase [Ectocarpus siliculosus]
MLPPHPLDQLSAAEITAVATAIKESDYDGKPEGPAAPRFNAITLAEPAKADLLEASLVCPRKAQVIFMCSESTAAYEALVEIMSAAGSDPPVAAVVSCKPLGQGFQPLLSPDDCDLAEKIVKLDAGVAKLLEERYGITDIGLLACDPWSYHVTVDDGNTPPLGWRDDGLPARLVQTFLYMRDDADDNHYAHPLDMLPVVDLNAQKVVHVDKQVAAPKVPKGSVNYHRNKVASNTYLPTRFRSDPPRPLEITQPDGPSFSVDGSLVSWQRWTLRIGFNYREGLVLHDVKFDDRLVMWRGSLVEMAVPYGDPKEPFTRKCAFDVGDYGLGFCTNSLELGCDCLGHIHYFDATLNDSRGQPYEVEKAVCMHEEDAGLLWKHVEYRNGHNESRRSRRLVLSFIATVVNYEYLFYWYLMQDGRIEFEIKLSGELSTNLLSEGESTPEHGVMVAPGVNAQLHQHMFCARLDMSVDGHKNTVMEADVVRVPRGEDNPAGNAFRAQYTPLVTEKQAQREANPRAARSWLIQNPSSINPINGKSVAYKLVPQTFGPTHPPLMTGEDSAVTARGEFATKALWVTPHRDDERWPAGDFTVQSTGGEGLPAWTKHDRNVEGEDVVLWHSFGLLHVPRVEDFPVMPCESTGFTLKPDGFFSGNPTIDLAPSAGGDGKSKCCSH